MSTEKYVFVSYAHKDSAVVLPCVEAMRKNGINVWYDEGIQAGSEWPEYIAEKVASCSKFILFISTAYLESQNCKRELNFAISRKKDILSVFIEDVVLTLGVEMQLGTYQSVFKNRFANDSVFYKSLCGEAWFNDCRNGNGKTSQDNEYVKPPISNGTARTYSPQPDVQKTVNPQRYYTPSVNVSPVKNRMVAALLAIFLGGLGVHKFYLGQLVKGVLYLLFCWTGIPFIIGFIEGLSMLFSSNEKFEKNLLR